jgi:uncharacterized protein YhhL (DUF1145 family)
MIAMLKVGAILTYAGALAGAVGLLPAGIARPVQVIAVGIVLLHALELLFAFRHIRRYPGPLAVSVLLTLLFGVLHWKPLADAARSGQTAS